MRGRDPFSGPVQLTLRAQFMPPASWSKKKREAAMGTWCVTKPDADNLAKVFADAFNGIVFLDDAQIAHLSAQKMYGPEDVVVVTVSAL